MVLATHSLAAQSASVPLSPDQGAAELDRLVNGLTVTSRVLVIGMRPEDEDSQLITWLSRGHQVETAYLSVTRGEAGYNFGGSESGSSLGAIPRRRHSPRAGSTGRNSSSRAPTTSALRATRRRS